MSERKPSRPLQVYLDSSDISVLSLPDAAQGDTAIIAEQLERWTRAGDIELRFSYIHVAEAAPTKLEHILSATARLELMHRLSWPHALAAPSDVLESEARSLLRGELSTDTFRRDDGNWLPSDIGDLALPSMSDVLRKAIIENAPTRQKRRAAERLCFAGDGSMTKQGRVQIARMAPAFVEAVCQQFPLTPASVIAVERYCKGEISGPDTMRSIVDSIRDVRVFSTWLQSSWREVSPTTAWLREDGERFRKSMEEISNQTDALWRHQLGVGMSKPEIQAIGTNALASTRQEFVFHQAAGLLKKPLDMFGTSRDPQRSRKFAPGMNVLADVMFEIAWQTCVLQNDRRRPKTSDAGDLTHCIYLPYVDVFRADGFMADAIKKTAPDLAHRVVGKFRNLGVEIERRLT